MLAKSPKKISIWEVLKLLESKHSLVDCLSDTHACEHVSDCPVRPIWGEAYKSMTKLFKDTSLQDVLEDRIGKSSLKKTAK